MKNILNKIQSFSKKESVLIISALAAIVSMFFVPPSSTYINYIDFRVLSILFCLMAVIKGLQSIGMFEVLSTRLLRTISDTRWLCYVLILLCFFLSMWITNDVALITLVPFTILVLNLTRQQNLMIFVIVMETIGANLGSMLTPIGNPQNLYLYTYYGLDGKTFFAITLPVVLVSLLIITIPILFIKNTAIKVEFNQNIKISDIKKLIVYLGLFLISIGTVFHLIPYPVTILIICIVLLFVDKKLLVQVDYSLLLTFVCFFLFVGNIGEIDSVKLWMNDFITDKVFLSSIVLSQGISNVPAAVLLSSFTDDYKNLILGTNIGGLGTLIASLASLISYKQYILLPGAKSFRYLLNFTVLNIAGLAVLIVAYLLIY